MTLHRPAAARPPGSPRRRPGVLGALALVVLLPSSLGATEDQDPIPPTILFPTPSRSDPETEALIDEEVGAFADLSGLRDARARIVRRFGLVSVPRLLDVLRGPSRTHTWNALLTVAALRSVYGAAPELYPALEDCVRILQSNHEEYTRGFAALALGCFPWREATASARPQEVDPLVPGPEQARRKALRRLREGRLALESALRDSGKTFLFSCTCLALARMGGQEAANALANVPRDELEGVLQRRQAWLLSRAFLLPEDPGPYFEALDVGREPQRISATAALGIAVCMLAENAPAWTRDGAKLNRALRALETRDQPHEGAEGLFARGVATHLHGGGDEVWREIWHQATLPSTHEEIVIAATQVLSACQEPFFERAVREWVHRPVVKLHPVLQAFLLLRAGSAGDSEGVRACLSWLSRAERPPRPASDWDLRWYAALALARAFHTGALRDPETCAQAASALERAHDRVLKPSPFREALGEILRLSGSSLRDPNAQRLDGALVERLEAALDCPYGLTGDDLRDVLLARVRAAFGRLFGFDSIQTARSADKMTEKQGERALQAFVEATPYFDRRALRVDRGWRPPLSIDDTPTSLGLDR